MVGGFQCVAGKKVCVGSVAKTLEICDKIDNNCNGIVDTDIPGYDTPCTCPGGYACNLNTNACDVMGVHNGCCVPDACAAITCPLGFNCSLDTQGNAMCVDPCLKVTCPPSSSRRRNTDTSVTGVQTCALPI